MRKFGETYRHGTLFAPRQCLYKRSYGYGDPKNVICLLVQIRNRPVRALLFPMFRTLSIGPSIENCGNSGEPNAMVPCLHQGNVYIKRKLRVWSDQKCNLLVGANTASTNTGPQTSHVSYTQYMAGNENCGNSSEPIAMVTCFHQRNVYIKRKLRVWRAQKCNLLNGANTASISTGPQTSHVSYTPYTASN